jgi:hypothetical protein
VINTIKGTAQETRLSVLGYISRYINEIKLKFNSSAVKINLLRK